jgi:DNA polymerase-3 subunit delta
VLVIEAQTWAANTKLYKAIDQTGLQIACKVPTRLVNFRPEPDLEKLARWLVAWAKKTHGVALENAAADELLHIIGPEMGLIDQELAKLALYVPPAARRRPNSSRM